MVASPFDETPTDDAPEGDPAAPVAYGVEPRHARRVSVMCGRHCVDLTLPAHEPVSSLLGGIADIFFERARATPTDVEGSLVGELCGPGPHGAWELSRLGGEAIPGDRTLAEASIGDGEPLVLAAPPAAAPSPLWDDSLAALSAHTSADVWQPEDSRRASLLLSGAIATLLAALLVVSLLRGPTEATAAVAVVAAVTTLAFTVIFRAHGAGAATAFAGVGFAGGFVFLAAASLVPGSPGALQALSGASAALLLGTLGAATSVFSRVDPEPERDDLAGSPYLDRDAFIAVAILATFVLVGAVLVRWAELTPEQVGIGLATIGWAVHLFSPSLAVAFSALPLPGASIDSKSAGDPLDMAEVHQFSAHASRLLLALTALSSTCVAGGAAVAVLGSDTTLWELAWALALASWLFLRLRTVPSRACGIVCMTSGTVAFLSTASTAFWNAETLVWLSVFAVLCIAVAAIVVAVGWWVPAKEFSPTARRAVDVVDVLLTCSVVPLALCAAGIVQAVRG